VHEGKAGASNLRQRAKSEKKFEESSRGKFRGLGLRCKGEEGQSRPEGPGRTKTLKTVHQEPWIEKTKTSTEKKGFKKQGKQGQKPG